MTAHWRLILSPPLSGPANMAIDEALLDSAVHGGRPTIRFYAWAAPCISVGRLQETGPLLDLDLCAARGIAVVRRMTGGRAILHHPGEVTYSVAAPEADAHLGGIMEAYRSINAALAAGLALLGVKAAMRERAPVWPDTGVGFGCFEDAYRHEVYWAGRKIIASAQRRQSGGFLQQGSIPGVMTGADLAGVLRLDPGKRTVLKRELDQRTGTLQRALDVAPPFLETARALADGFRQTWGVDIVEGALTQEEQASAAALERDVYGRPLSPLGRAVR